jgi:GNAT superfamily N-acetyltransferase
MARDNELVTIRECEKRDLPDVIALLGELALAMGDEFTSNRTKAEKQYLNMSSRPETYRNYVCEFGGRVVAFASVVFYESFFHEVGTALINEFVVGSKYRGLAIGKTLLSEIEEEAKTRSMDEIEVGLMRTNRPAYEFYKKCGLTEEYILLGKEFIGD